jgi:hypothetical protein
MQNILRSDVEFSKRVFLDRMGLEYEYALAYDPFNLGVGADCSGSAGIFIGAAVKGPNQMSWARMFSTETFPGPFAGLFRKVSKAELLASNSPIKVAIMHGGGGPYSHMNVSIDGMVMESNGDNGTCTMGNGAIGQDSDFWNAWWIADATIIEDTTWRQKMEYLKGFDFSSGRPGAKAIKDAGGSFVMRYLTDGGNLKGKQLLPDEFSEYLANGISVGFNWQTTANFMLRGYEGGKADAAQALSYVRSLPKAPQNPVIYFSCDFDEAPSQDQAIFDYLRAAAEVLGGVERVGLYGGYWICKRAKDAGVTKYIWQTPAWSGDNVDSRINLFQNINLGQPFINGVQCDINEAHTDDFGQFPGPAYGSEIPTPPSDPGTNLPPVNNVVNDFSDKYPSLSRYVDPDAIPYFSLAEYLRFIDAKVDEAAVEKYAMFGHIDSIKSVVRNAQSGDSKAMVIVDRITDSSLQSAGFERASIAASFNQNKGK